MVRFFARKYLKDYRAIAFSCQVNPAGAAAIA